MKPSKLDRIDRKILATLQADGRMTNVDLARLAGISAPPCLRRVRALEEAGYIRTYHAFLDAGKLGYGVSVFAHVSLASHNDADLRRFEEKVQGWPQVREAHLLSGETDVLLKIVARDWESYQQFLTSQLLATENVAAVRSSIAIRTTKLEPGVPIAETSAAG